MSSVLPLDRVIQLSAIYYLAVFILEVPSGYFSDRIGRRTTLLLAALCLAVAFACFIVGSGFWLFVAGQFFLAAGVALQSGTDTAFHYDALKSLGRESEYSVREAKAEQWGLTMLAIATLCGGALGMIDLRLAYVFSLFGALAMGALVWQLVEPTNALANEPTSGETTPPASFISVLSSCIGRLRDSVLGWIFLTMILLYAMAHIVYEFYQPYIALLDIAAFEASHYTPLISGVVIAVSMFGGALAAKVSVAWQSRLGLVGLLAVATLIQLSIVASMALLVHAAVLVLVFARNFPMALVHAPVNAAIAPRIDSEQRATYLSIQGLSERLVFALLLLVLSSTIETGQAVSEAALLPILSDAFYLGVVVAAVLFLFFRYISRLLNAGS